MQFIPLTNKDQLSEIEKKSFSKPQIIFKHSTRCSISAGAKRVLLHEMGAAKDEDFDIHYLDLLNYRELSNQIESRYKVKHESPQILVIKNGECVYHASHGEVALENCESILHS
jgi:bacillithiol system protein YtxJ